MWLEDEGLEARFLVHDGDAKFSAHFRESWRPEVRCLRTPPRSPTANSYAESFIGTLKHECLNHFVCFSLQQLDRIGRCGNLGLARCKPTVLPLFSRARVLGSLNLFEESY